MSELCLHDAIVVAIGQTATVTAADMRQG